MSQVTQFYKDYMVSAPWIKLRDEALARDNYLCQACFSNMATQVHHLTYIRLFHELPKDLLSVCTRCHRIITRANRKNRFRELTK